MTCPHCTPKVYARMTIAEIQKTVAHYYKLPARVMVNHRRDKQISQPRQIAMYLSRELTPKSLPDIARRFGNRDHTTIMHGIAQTILRMKNDEEVRQDVETLRLQLTN